MAVNKRRLNMNTVSSSCGMPGVWRAVSHNEGCVVVYHSPDSCAHITDEMERNFHLRTMARGEYKKPVYTAPLITSGIGRNESIFGGAAKLSSCIDYVVDTYKPGYLVVTDSCVAGVIGDDTASICEDMEKKHHIPVIYVPVHGFLEGEYYGGYVDVCRLLIDRFARPAEKIPTTVTVIGEKDGPDSTAMRDFRELLSYFGITGYCRFPGYCTKEEIESLGKSAFSVIVGGTPKAYRLLRSVADYMTEKLDVPHFAADYPAGLLATEEWVRRLGTFMRREDVVPSVIQKIETSLEEGYAPYKERLAGQPVTIYLGQRGADSMLKWLLEFLDLGRIPVHRFILADALTGEDRRVNREYIEARWKNPVIEDETAETKLSPKELVMTTQELSQDNLRQLMLPMLPPIGVRGFLHIYKKLYLLARRSEGRGVVLYGW